jgi:hypothetical protein
MSASLLTVIIIALIMNTVVEIICMVLTIQQNGGSLV